jgi:predicted extracellular nuclease/sulfur carrier protein ThiS
VGEVVQVSGVTANDFSSDVTYIVTAEDGETTKNWVVTVTEAVPVLIAYSTGFESSEGFVASTTYNNTTIKYDGPVGQKWGIYHGTVSINNVISGSQSLQMRWYLASPANLGYAFTNFDISNPTKVTFKAKRAAQVIGVTVSYSIDGGTSYVNGQTYSLTTTASDYTYIISESGEFSNVRLKFQLSFTTNPTDRADLIIDNIEVQGMDSPPVPTFFPVSGAIDVPLNVNPTITFNEPIFLSGVAVENADLAGLITFEDGAAQPVNFNATISGTVITVVLVSDLDYSTEYTLTIAPVEDEAGNPMLTSASASFTTVVYIPSDDATLSVFELGSESVLGLTGILVADPENDPGATLYVDDFGTFIGILVETTDANATVEVTINSVAVDEEDYGTQVFMADNIVLATVTAEDGTTKKYYKVTLLGENRVLTLTAPVGGETYNTGDEIVITWTYENIANVNLWAYNGVSEELHQLNESPIAALEGTFSFNISNGIAGDYFIRITDASDADFYNQSASEITIVDNVAPSIEELFPENNATDVSTSFTLSITFDESIVKGTGNLTIHKVADNSVVATFTQDVVTVDHDIVTVDVVGLDFGTAYYINIQAGMFVDVSGNPNAAISNNSTWTFTTVEEPANDLFFSEYIEGTSNNKALEIYNPTNQNADLSLYVIKSANNGNGWGNTLDGPDTRYVLPLTGSLAPGEVLVIANALASQDILDEADIELTYNSTINGCDGCNVLAFNGDDAIGLFINDELIDVIGIPTEDPGTNWPVAGTGATSEFTLVRKSTVITGNTDWLVSAGTNAENSEWIVYPQNTFDYLGWHGELIDNDAPVATFAPLNGATDVALNVTPTISFDEPVRNLDDSEITDGNLGDLLTFTDGAEPVAFTASINVGKTIITVTPAASLLKGVTYTLTLASVEDDSGNATAEQSVSFTTILPSTVATLATFEIGSTNALALEAIEVASPEDAGAELFVAELVGLSVTATDPNATVTVKKNGDIVEPAAYAALTYVAGDVILVTVVAEDGITTKYYKVTLTDTASDQTDILTYSIAGQVGDALLGDGTIAVVMPFGTDVTELIANFTLSNGASVKVGEVVQVSGETVNDFTLPVTYVVTAEDGVTTNDWVVTVTLEAGSTEADILTFSFAEQTGPAIIGDGTIAVEVASGTVLTNLIATFTLSDGASAKVGEVVQVSGVTANDFSSDVTYIVTAEDGETTKNWVVTVTEAVPVLIAYSTGFESSEGFVASTTYNNTTIKYDGPVGQKWGIYHGTVSINNVISGSQSLQMRWYLASPANLGYAFTNFDISNPTKVTFKAKRAAQVIGVTVSYSIDGGTSYVNGQTYSLTTTASDYTYIISESGEFSNVRLKFQLSFTTNPTDRADLIIDNIEVQGMDSPPVPTFFPVSGAIDVPLNVHPSITFNKPVFIDGEAIEDADLAGLITFVDGESQAVAFNATIVGKLITVVPSAELNYSTTYTLTIAPVEDAAGNAMANPASTTFTTVAYIPSDDAALSVFELGGIDVLTLNGILVGDPQNDAGASLYVEDFMAFVGIEAATNDANAMMSVAIDGVLVPADNYTTQTFEDGDVVLATVIAEDETTTKYYKVTLTSQASSEADFQSYSIAGQVGGAVINFETEAISVTVPFGTNTTALIATFTLSEGATAKVGEVVQVSGETPNDFTEPVTYVITAQDGITTKEWTVTVTVESGSTEADILTFSFAEQTGPATLGDGTIAIEVANGTLLTNLVATFTLSEGASAKVGEVVQESGVTSNDFSSDVTYIVTAQDGETTKDWVVTVIEEEEDLSVAIFTETMGTVSATTTIAAHETANGFDNDGFTMSGNADVRNTTPSTGYENASGVANIFFGTAGGINNRDFVMAGINTLNYSDITLSFGVLSTVANNMLTVEYSTDGTTFTPLTVDNTIELNTWALKQASGNIPSSETLTLRFSKNSTTQFRLDDVRMRGVFGDSNPPVPTFLPVSGAIDIPLDVQPTITFNEPIFVSEGVAVTNDNVNSIITFVDGESQAVAFNATIDGLVITVVPGADLAYSTTYTLTIAPVEDAAGNAMETSASATFTTVAYVPSNDATLSLFKLGGVDALLLGGVVVTDPETDEGATLWVEDLVSFIGIEVSPTDDLASVTITVNGVVVAEGDYETQTFEDADIVLATVVAEDAETTIYYKVNVQIDDRELELTLPVGGETFYAGQDLTFTWTSANIEFVNLWTFDGENLSSINQTPIDASLGTFTVNIPNGVNGTFFIRITDASDATFYSQSVSEITVIDELNPSIEGTYPLDGAIDMPLSFTLFIEFDENIAAGEGNFIIHKLSDDSEFITVASSGFAINHKQVSYNVQGLEYETSYYVTAPEGLFDDISGNPSPAITKDGDIKLHFTTVEQPTAELFFSEYIEGSVGSNKAIEIYNPFDVSVDLSVYSVKLYPNGATNPTQTQVLSGTLSPGDVYVIVNSGAVQEILDVADISSAVTFFNGDDALGLYKNNELIDVFGIIGTDPGDAWVVAGVANATKDHTLIRKLSVTKGTTDWAISAGTNEDNSQWIVLPDGTHSYLGWHGEQVDTQAPVATFTPADQTINVPIDVIPTISFNEPIRNIDNSEITNENVAALIEFTFGENQVEFNASINEGKTLITITPTENLLKGFTYTLSILPVEDESDNATVEQSVSFTTILPNSVATLAAFEIGGTNVLILEGIEVANPEDAGAELFVAELVGLSVTATDPYATVTVMKNGDIVEPADYAALTYVAGDVILVTVVAENGETTKYYKVTLSDTASDQADILTYSIAGQVGNTVLGEGTIAVVMPFGTDVTELIANFTLSYGATATVGEVSQVSGVTPNNFTESVAYVVTAQDGVTTNDWVVTVTVEAGSTEAEILTFSFAEQTGPATLGDGTIAIEVANGTLLTSLVATFTLSEGASAKVGEVVQESGVTANDFSSDVTYIVTAEDGETTKNWVVTVTEEEEDLSVAIFTETMGTVSATTTIAAHETANGFDNDGFTMSGNADVRSTTPSTGYENASGVANIFFGTAGGINNRDFVMAGINTLNYTDITLSFGVLSTVANNMLTVEYSTDGTTFTPLTVDNTIALNTWALKQASGNIPSSETLTLRFSKNSTTQFRLDDVRMRGVYDDSNPPVPTFFPVSGAIDVPLNVHPTITFNKPIFIGGVAVTNDNINSLITFVDSETQAVAFNATIEGLVITIVPEVDLTYSTAYTLTIAPVEDEEGNVMAASASATFTTVAYVPSNDATLSLFNIGEVNVLLLNGIVVTDPETELGATLYTEDISSLIGIMVTTNDANALVTITINGVVVAADDYATQTFGDGDIILATVVAEDETTTMYYKVNVQFDDRELELTYPVGGETFYAGQTITFMWTSANINNLNIWAYDAVNQQLHLLNEEGPIVATAGTFIYNINNGISGLYFIRITDASDASFFDQTASEIIVIDELVPEIIGLFPNNGAVDVPITFNLRIEFDEVIDHGTGNFIINKLIDDSPVLTVTSQNFNLMGNAAILQVQGLDYETAYYITSVEGVFVDNSGNPSLAITKEGAIQWHFTTMEEPQADLFFSEYIEGTSNNKALEIYNPTGQTVDLSLYVVKSANNGNGWGNTADGPDTRYVLPLTGTLAPGEVLVIANAQASQDVLDEADITLTYNSTVNGCDGCNVLAFNGDDAVGLFNNDVLIDVIGVPDVDPGTNWPVAGTGATSEFTLVRKSTVITGNTDWLASAGTNADDSEWIVFPQNTFEYLGWHLAGLNDEAEILAFAVENQMGETLIDSEAATITIEVLNGTNLAALIPTFSLSMSATAYVDGIEQVSGTSVVNFTSSVLYTVVAEDGINQKVWTVTITEAAVSTEAEILSFAVVGQIGSSIINSQAASVEVQVVFGTDIANLVPTINISLGAIINPNSGTAQDFTNPVVYTVTAQDGVTTKDWTVTVNVASIFPIYDIQFTDHPSGASPFEGEVITTSGIVTAWHYNFEGGTFQGIFIQDGEGAWNGLYVFNPQMNPIPAVGDSILVTGIVKEYYGLTELTFDALQGVEVEITNISSGLELPAPAIVTTAQANEEAWESVLIRVLDVLCTNDNSGFGMAEINDGSGPLKVDDDMHAAALVIDKRYNITGIGHYSYSEYKILPRSAEDVELLSSVLITWGENINAYPNPFSNIIWIDNAYDASRVLIFNLLGQQVLNVNLNGEMRATIHTDGLPFGVYLITVVNDKGNRIVRKMIKK